MQLHWNSDGMKNLLFTLSLGLLNNENFVINSQGNVLPILEKIIGDYDFSYKILDLSRVENLGEFIDEITYDEEGLRMFEIVVLNNLDKVNEVFQRELVRFFDELKEFDCNLSRFQPKDHVIIEGKKILKSQFQCFIGNITISQTPVKLYKNLKERFWFSQFEQEKDEDWLVIDNYRDTLIQVRQNIDNVYMSPEILSYITSLIVHTRNHRLNTINQIQTRLHTSTIEKVIKLSKSIVSWKNPQAKDLFLTPQICQLAFRKIGYWLVDWEDSKLFNFLESKELENRRQLIINMLVGEWYGSEWKYVKQYLKDHESKFDEKSNTGFSNSIIEDVIVNVRPPI